MKPLSWIVAAMFTLSLACSGADLAPGSAAGAVPPPEPAAAAPADDGDGEPVAEPSAIVQRGAFEAGKRPCDAHREPGLYHLDTEFGGQTTRSVLYVPATPGPHDLVVLLHAGSATPQKILGQTRFAEQAARDGFLVLAPLAADVDGRGLHWNSGKFSTVVDESHQRDDVGFLDALVRKVKPEVCAGRVVTAGFSSGGQMAHRWACEGTEVDGALTAAGELLVDPASCKGPRVVRGYVGTLDKVFDGPPLEGSDQPSAPETMAMWARINRCSDAAPVETRVEEVTCRAWQGCEASTELCVVEGFPHGWPSPWHRKKPIRANATADGIVWFRSTAPPVPSPEPDGQRKSPKR